MNKFKHFISKYKEEISIVLTAFFLLAGILQYWIGWAYVLKLMPIVIGVITSLVILFWDIPPKQRLRAIIFAIGVGTLAEVIGVNSGWIFGDYTYGDYVLGIKVLGVPLLVGIMWLLVTVSAWQIALLGGFNKWMTAFLASWIVVIFDLVLEQYATAYGLWSWQGGQIPLLNYLSWFFVSQLIFIGFMFFIKKHKASYYGVAALPMMMFYFWFLLIFT